MDQDHPNTAAATTAASSSSSAAAPAATEPVRSRWTPKPEQILILESIFNSGMVNPPKDETVRIRKLLEKFGAVGDANVFYWFQNRRSRSRRRQRQLQASLQQPPPPHTSGGGAISLEYCGATSAPPPLGFNNNNNNSNNNNILNSGASFQLAPPQASEYEFCGKDDAGGSLSISAATQLDLLPPENPNFSYHLPPGGGIITVFLNGVATQVPAGPFDHKAMFGDDVILVHSTGVPVPFNEYGVSLSGLQHGESYFLVPRLA